MKTKEEKSLEKRKEQDVQRVEEEVTYVPLTDIYDKNDTIIVRCDLPGVAEDDVEVELENNQLTIIGKQLDFNIEGLDQMMGEYGTGVFRRSFKVSQDIDQENIIAKLQNGVLELELPKAQKVMPKKIAVQVG